MEIIYQSRAGLPRVTIPQLLGSPLGSWANGETKTIDDALQLPVQVRKVSRSGELRTAIESASAADAILTAGPDFRKVGVPDPSGQFEALNPNYVCSQCGRETTEEYFTAANAQGAIVQFPYVDEHGNRLCPRDYLLAQPVDGVAWQRHTSVEHSTAVDEANDALATTPVAEPAAPAAAAAAPPRILRRQRRPPLPQRRCRHPLPSRVPRRLQLPSPRRKRVSEWVSPRHLTSRPRVPRKRRPLAFR